MNSPFKTHSLEDLLLRKDSENLKDQIKSFERIWLFDERGTGKSSLVNQALQEEKTIYINCLKVHNYTTFLSLFAKQLLESLFPIQETLASSSIDDIYDYFPDLKMSLQLKPSPHFIIDESPENLAQLLDSLKQWKEKNNIKVFLIFDEFQEVFEFEKSEHLEIKNALESHHAIFIGNNKEHKNKIIMEELFSKPQSAYYNFASFYKNPSFDANEWESYLSEHISYAKEIIEYSQDNIYFITKLAHTGYILKAKSIDPIKKHLISQNEDYFKSIFDTLSKNQKKTLLLIAKAGQNIYKSENLNEFELSKSATERCLGSFIKNDIVKKKKRNIYFSNPLFRDWILDTY